MDGSPSVCEVYLRRDTAAAPAPAGVLVASGVARKSPMVKDLLLF